MTDPGEITIHNLPRLNAKWGKFDEFGDERIAIAKKKMNTKLHLMEPKFYDKGIFEEIKSSSDPIEITNLYNSFVEANEEKSLMRTIERQAVCEAGLRKLVELCCKRGSNQRRWIGETNENLHCNQEMIRRVLQNIQHQCICYDDNGGMLFNNQPSEKGIINAEDVLQNGESMTQNRTGKGGSSQNRGCEVACMGMQFLMFILQPTGTDSASQKERALLYRDTFFNCRATEVVTFVLKEQGACNWRLCQKKNISAKVAYYGISVIHALIENNSENVGYALSVGALEAVDACVSVHGRTNPRVRKIGKITLDLLHAKKSDPLYNLEAEAQRLKIIAEEPGSTIEERVAAARVAAKLQVAKMG
jgi:hypothetical protein